MRIRLQFVLDLDATMASPECVKTIFVLFCSVLSSFCASVYIEVCCAECCSKMSFSFMTFHNGGHFGLLNDILSKTYRLDASIFFSLFCFLILFVLFIFHLKIRCLYTRIALHSNVVLSFSFFIYRRFGIDNTHFWTEL